MVSRHPRAELQKSPGVLGARTFLSSLPDSFPLPRLSQWWSRSSPSSPHFSHRGAVSVWGAVRAGLSARLSSRPALGSKQL